MANLILHVPKIVIGARGADYLGNSRWRLAERLKHGLGLLLLRGVAFLHDFFQQLAGSVLVAHLLVRLREVELGRYFLPSRVGSGARAVAASGRAQVEADAA